MQIYVSASVKRSGDGSQAAPFQTINEAAQVAVAGDEVIVLPGYYRELSLIHIFSACLGVMPGSGFQVVERMTCFPWLS